MIRSFLVIVFLILFFIFSLIVLPVEWVIGKFNPEYRFTKHQGLAFTAGIWCFGVTALCCVLGMYVEGDPASTALNVITPFVLTALGLILPIIKKRETERAS